MATTVTRVIRVGTRGSKLALRQTGLVVAELSAAHPGIEFQTAPISTAGDRDKQTPLERVGVAVFVKELEAALDDGRVDIAVHSLKDMPSELPPGFTLAALPGRADPRDVLVNRWQAVLDDLPAGARIGTGSPRRRAQLLAARRDLDVVPIRGNVDTRLAKALGDGTGYDGAVLAAAGLDRLGPSRAVVAVPLDPERFVPAAGQGTLAIETRTADGDLTRIAAVIDHTPTRIAATAERAVLARIGGGCASAVSAYATVAGDTVTVRAFASDADGRRPILLTRAGPVAEAAAIGAALADEMIAGGAKELILE
ncbi:MAG: hydroxymethylbilane synthase [Dehalococcoidia bacterium]